MDVTNNPQLEDMSGLIIGQYEISECEAFRGSGFETIYMRIPPDQQAREEHAKGEHILNALSGSIGSIDVDLFGSQTDMKEPEERVMTFLVHEKVCSRNVPGIFEYSRNRLSSRNFLGTVSIHLVSEWLSFNFCFFLLLHRITTSINNGHSSR